jgi:hypothetical protein
MSNIEDLISQAVNKQPTEFNITATEMLGSKAYAALSGIKNTLAQSICSEPTSSVQTPSE